MKTLICNGTIINESKKFRGYVIIHDKYIDKVAEGDYVNDKSIFDNVIDAEEGYIIPGVIDDQVHFREPGLTYKGDILSESRAAVAGGVTSYMEMPNTKPPTTSIEALNEKYDRASEVSYANYSFYFGATNDNAHLLSKLDIKNVCGVKLFMGSSTGNMLVDSPESLNRIFAESPLVIAVHAEEEAIVQKNRAYYTEKYAGKMIPDMHPLIRSEEACYVSSAKAVDLAVKHNARLHILHLSTARELSLFSTRPLSEKRITSEICLHHLWFSDEDYKDKGNFILWNPAIKTINDRDTLREGVRDGRVDVIATDHAPHSFEEKQGQYPNVPSGGPLVQHSLTGMFELAVKGEWNFEKVVEKMCHAPADLFRVNKRGYIREGYFADIVVIKPEEWIVDTNNILYKCGWSPFLGDKFSYKVSKTIVNGTLIYNNGEFNDMVKGERLTFNN